MRAECMPSCVLLGLSADACMPLSFSGCGRIGTVACLDYLDDDAMACWIMPVMLRTQTVPPAGFQWQPLPAFSCLLTLHLRLSPPPALQYLGTFTCEVHAARAYDLSALEHRGRAAVTNFDVSDYYHPETGQLLSLQVIGAVGCHTLSAAGCHTLSADPCLVAGCACVIIHVR
jgi:hypothetical protein